MLQNAALAGALRSHLEGEDLVQHHFLAGPLVIVAVSRESDPAAGDRYRFTYDQVLGDMVVMLTGLAKDKAVFPLVNVLTRLALFDLFRGAEIRSISLFAVRSVNTGLAAVLAGELHLGLGRQIHGGGHIVIDVAPLAFPAVNHHLPLVLSPHLKVTLLEHDRLLLTGDGVLQTFAGLQENPGKAHVSHIGIALGNNALIAGQVLETVYLCVRHLLFSPLILCSFILTFPGLRGLRGS